MDDLYHGEQSALNHELRLERNDQDVCEDAERIDCFGSQANEQTAICVVSACTHNLKNVNVNVPWNKTVAIAGPSGSGKSSLAFDTIFIEGQRQYMESLAAYSRQYMRRMTRPEVVSIRGLQPTIALDQQTGEPNPRSCVATITEVSDYLRVLYSRVGVAHCYKCGRPIQRQTVEQIQEAICNLPQNVRFMLLAPVVREKRGSHLEVFQRLAKAGYSRARVDGSIVSIESIPSLDPNAFHTIEAVVDRLLLREGIETRLLESLKIALQLSDGQVCCLYEKERQQTTQGTVRSVWKDLLFSVRYSCPRCGVSYIELEPRSFSFNSSYGACRTCRGIGKLDAFDANLLVPNRNLTLETGALVLGKALTVVAQRKLTALFQAFQRIASKEYASPLSFWNEDTIRLFFYGNSPQELEEEADELKSWNGVSAFDENGLRDDLESSGGNDDEETSELIPSVDDKTEYEFDDLNATDFNSEGKNSASLDSERDKEGSFLGLIPTLERIYATTKSEREREYLDSFRGKITCPDCGGARIRREARTVKVDDKTLADAMRLTVAEALVWFKQLKFEGLKQTVAPPLIAQIVSRLETMKRLRLDYLTLDRSTDSLSGGELQRARLTTALGSCLSGVCYILDEPTTGLHPRDIACLLDVIESLRARGNTVIVVEHNQRVIMSSDWLIDVGPGAGKFGGEIVACGTPAQVAQNDLSPTGRYLSGKKAILTPDKRRKISKTRSILLEGVQTNNLRDVSVAFPLGVFICVTGVSGSGKSSLVSETLVPALQARLKEDSNLNDKVWRLRSIRGASRIDKLVVVDQTPLGRSPRSNPATYSGVFDEIRKVFSSSSESRRRGYKAGRFSFNIAGGRCEVCQGLGYHRIESTILPDMFVKCPECEGKRFNRATLEIKYQGKSIADVLDMSFDEARDFFANHTSVLRYIDSFRSVGLGYLTLGQSATSLSGGEAQRVKLATELANIDTGNTLYVLDEPTAGLHPQDVEHLLSVLQRLVDAGNTVITIEHSVDVMRVADWIIDLGPEGGNAGGNVLAVGTPEDIAQLANNDTGQYLREALFRSNGLSLQAID